MTKKFQLAAKVLLSRRLKNLVPIEDHLEIDLSYVTCAEYQLFIDQKRQGGENRQPDHWKDDRFPPGDAQKLITGVRASDAEEFCEWLTQQHSDLGFRYRLPTVAEVEENPATEKQIGCWCKHRGEKVIVGIEVGQLQDWHRKLAELIILKGDFDLYRNLNSDLNRNLYRLLNRDIYSGLTRNLTASSTGTLTASSTRTSTASSTATSTGTSTASSTATSTGSSTASSSGTSTGTSSGTSTGTSSGTSTASSTEELKQRKLVISCFCTSLCFF